MASPSTDIPALEQPVETLRGVGPKLSTVLNKAGIFHVKDLLFRLPLRYLDKTRITPMGSLRANSYVVIQGEILASDILFGRRRSLMVKLGDGTGMATLRFFHFSQSQKAALARGKFLRCSGEVRPGRAGLELYHPEYEFIEEDSPAPAPELTPIYSTTEGLSQVRLRDLCSQALEILNTSDIEELFSAGTQQLSLKDALKYLHRPPADAPVDQLLSGKHPLQKKIIFEELVAHQLSQLKARQRIKSQSASVIDADKAIENKFIQQLPFKLTSAQEKSLSEIHADLVSGHPMLRLLQGDVGSGKTLVAALAILSALVNQKQAVMMAPTEILAEQHMRSLQSWLEPLGYKILFLSSKIKGKAREAVLNLVKKGEAHLLVGTHALIQPDVIFNNLALVVIDEQHRFGVNQRLNLRAKGNLSDQFPHQLIMTATPIPRTLAMSHYSDLDTSVIDELPPGRTPVTTVALPDIRRKEVIQRVDHLCEQDRQVYWVCTLVEESEELQAQAAEATADELRLALPRWPVGLIHGRMKASEKSRIMEAFRHGEIKILVATTVIEVGVDVPNASLMIIENPERLGLSQLHQLRGRVGRGAVDSHCVLLYKSPLSEASNKRISAMRETSDGFRIADIDLQLRGPGELLGSRQAGEAGYLMADLQRDAELIPDAAQEAFRLMQESADKASRLLQRWLPDAQRYLDA